MNATQHHQVAERDSGAMNGVQQPHLSAHNLMLPLNRNDASTPIMQCFKTVFNFSPATTSTAHELDELGDQQRQKSLGLLEEQLDALPEQARNDLLSGEIRDVRGRTLIQLAVACEHYDVVQLLMERGAKVNVKMLPDCPYTVFDELTLQNNVSMLFSLFLYSIDETEMMSNDFLNKYKKFFNDIEFIGQLYVEFKYDLSLRYLIPLNFLLPCDTIKAYITKDQVRFDMTLTGFKFKWHRSDHTMIIKKNSNGSFSYIHMIHAEKKMIQINSDDHQNQPIKKDLDKIEYLEKKQKTKKKKSKKSALKNKSAASEFVHSKFTSPVVVYRTKVSEIVFKPHSSYWNTISNSISGILGFNQTNEADKNDVIEYEVQNVALLIRTNREHLNVRSDEEKKLLEKVNEDGKIDLIIRSHPISLSEEQYFDVEKYNHVYESEHNKEKRKKMSIRSWNSKKYFPLLEKFAIPSLELFSSYHYLIDEIVTFLRSDTFPGFPVKLSFNVNIIHVELELINLYNHNCSVRNVRNTGIMSCEIDDSVFEVPGDDYVMVSNEEFIKHFHVSWGDIFKAINH